MEPMEQELVEYGPFPAKGINCIVSRNVATTPVWVDSPDDVITVLPPQGLACEVRVEENTLIIEGPRGGGNITGGLNFATLQVETVSGPGVENLVQVKMPSRRTGTISLNNHC